MGIDKSVGWVKGGAKPGQLESASVEEKPETLTVLANPRDNEDFFFFFTLFPHFKQQPTRLATHLFGFVHRSRSTKAEGFGQTQTRAQED